MQFNGGKAGVLLEVAVHEEECDGEGGNAHDRPQGQAGTHDRHRVHAGGGGGDIGCALDEEVGRQTGTVAEQVHGNRCPDSRQADAGGDGQQQSADEGDRGAGPDEPGYDEHGKTDGPEGGVARADDASNRAHEHLIGADGNHGMTHGDNQRDDHDDAEQLDTRVDNGIIERLNGADETAFVEIADDEDAQCTGQDDLFFEQERGEHGDRDDDIGDVQGSERDQGGAS